MEKYERYIYSFLILLASLVAGKTILFFLRRKVNAETETDPGLAAVIIKSISKPVTAFIFLGGIYLSLIPLQAASTKLTKETWDNIHKILSLATSVGIAYFIYSIVDIVEFYFMRWAKTTDSKLDDMLVGLVRKALRITIVLVMGLYIAEQVSGKSIATILTGLGIGGVAIALAAKDSIANIFGFVMILFDKPFTIGERVVVSGHDGVVEEMGFRSTRIRTLDGHLVTIPNNTMANSEIKNISKRPFIKRVGNITITYDTPIDKVEKAVDIIRDLLEKMNENMPEGMPPRVYFNEFNDWALNILMIYWYEPAEYWDAKAFDQKVNLEIMRQFEQEGIEFAFPSSTMYLANDDKRQLALKMLDQSKD